MTWFARVFLAPLVVCGCTRGPAPSPPPLLTTTTTASSSAAAPLPSAEAPIEARRCDAKSCNYREETCCEAESDRHVTGCVSKKDKRDNGHKCYGALEKDWIGIECLTTADCSGNERCCASGYDVTFNHCAEQCDIHEACMPSLGGSGGCRKGFSCHPVADARSGGVCFVESPQTACGKLRCSGATPACCYDIKKQSARCIAMGENRGWPEESVCAPSLETALLECTTPADCGGELCCRAGPIPVTSCEGMCMNGGWACGSLKDCPEFIGPPIACEPDPEGPPFLKTCKYRAPNGDKI